MEIRDIGSANPYSMKDGVIFPHKRQLQLYLLGAFIMQYNFHYRTTPRKFKVHRSLHPYVLFGLSIYIPYRYQAILNTMLFQLTKSKNPLINKLVRFPATIVIYSISIATGQFLARLYWVYKRSFTASKQATLNTYLQYRTY